MKRSIPAMVLAGLLVAAGALADPVNINTGGCPHFGERTERHRSVACAGDCRLPREKRTVQERR